MPSPRRVRLLFYVVLGGLITILFFTSRFRQTQEGDPRTIQDFYHKTVNGIEKASGGYGNKGAQKVVEEHDHDADGDIDEDDEIMAKAMAERLKAAEQTAKDNANAKAPNKPDAPEAIIGVGSSASGQGKKGKGGDREEPARETEEDHEVESEINAILKKSPSTSLLSGGQPARSAAMPSIHC